MIVLLALKMVETGAEVMNRAERRRLKIKGKEPVMNIKRGDIDAMKQQATKVAVNRAFFLMLAIPTMVIHDKFGKLMKRDGREKTFAELCIDLYDSYDKGYVTLDELAQVLWEEAGIKVDGVSDNAVD